jgi:hypothetical protein
LPLLPATVECEVRAFPERFHHIPGSLGHGGHPRRRGCTSEYSMLPNGEEDVKTNADRRLCPTICRGSLNLPKGNNLGLRAEADAAH